MLSGPEKHISRDTIDKQAIFLYSPFNKTSKMI